MQCRWEKGLGLRLGLQLGLGLGLGLGELEEVERKRKKVKKIQQKDKCFYSIQNRKNFKKIKFFILKFFYLLENSTLV